LFRILSPILVVLSLTFSAYANVMVSSPTNGETVSSSAHFVATANTTCSRGVASMGVYLDNQLVYVVNGTALNTTLVLPAGYHTAVVQEWDYCGGATKTSIPVNVTGKTGVWVSSPANYNPVSTTTNYLATGTTDCAKGVAAMGVYVNNQLAYVSQGPVLNTQINLQPGIQNTVVQEWDYCGNVAKTPVTVNVESSAHTFTNIQSNSGWQSWGQLAPTYADCNNPCKGVNWSMLQKTVAPDNTAATRFSIEGTTPYSDVLWENPVIGQFSTENMPDTGHTLLPQLHNFTYNADFYLTNAKATQAEEFDVNWFMNGVGITWGTECRIEGGHEWDIWDNADAKWVPTGVPCNPVDQSWNHVTVNVQRGANNSVIYQSITLNGTTYTLNKTYTPFQVPTGWYGVTVNYQMDGDYHQTANTTYLKNFSLTYW
jgi:hypothetical protein